ncbi:uncharacterized protein [Periplaneta americana]|uniref:uncharacterized protein n=1 Tax=Periplaneta americana TaxID=6978 RepID=UPI0037E9870D
MLSYHALVKVAVLILVSLVDTGISLPKLSSDMWRPVSFQSRMNSRALEPHEDAGTSSWMPSSDSAEYRVMQRVLDDCIKSDDGVSCLKKKAVTFLDRVARLQNIPLFSGVSLAREEGEDDVPVPSEAEVEATLPRDLDGKSDRLDQMIYDRLTNFLDSHTLVMDFSEKAVEEGRRRGKKKMIGYLMMGLAAAAATVGPIAFKSLAALAFKALVVAKVALVLSSLVALKKLTHHEGSSRSSEESPASWARSFSEDTTEQAHKMAYSAQLQRPITVT